jgi:hypothetical protein
MAIHCIVQIRWKFQNGRLIQDGVEDFLRFYKIRQSEQHVFLFNLNWAPKMVKKKSLGYSQKCKKTTRCGCVMWDGQLNNVDEQKIFRFSVCLHLPYCAVEQNLQKLKIEYFSAPQAYKPKTAKTNH